MALGLELLDQRIRLLTHLLHVFLQSFEALLFGRHESEADVDSAVLWSVIFQCLTIQVDRESNEYLRSH